MTTGNASYKSGRRFEYRVRDVLKELGYEVVRSAGSHSPADLVAFGRGYVLAVQCKHGKARVSKEEGGDLCHIAWSGGDKCKPVRVRPDGKALFWEHATQSAVAPVWAMFDPEAPWA